MVSPVYGGVANLQELCNLPLGTSKKGAVRLQEVDRTVGAGEIVGEIGVGYCKRP